MIEALQTRPKETTSKRAQIDWINQELTIPKTQRGDIWQLGLHRVMCGDSLDRSNFTPLLGDQEVDLYLTDPPYNVGYTGRTKDKLTIANDRQSDESFSAFLEKAFTHAAAILKPGGCFYIWHSETEVINFRTACMKAGLTVRQCLIWSKNHFSFGRKDYHMKHEPCLYGWKSGAVHAWYGDRKQTTILNFNRIMRSTLHPTMKPVDMFRYLIRNSSQYGEVVFDSFLGSGTTLIASEIEGRICYGFELEPHFTDVIVKRYIEWMQEKGEIPVIRHNGRLLEVGAGADQECCTD